MKIYIAYDMGSNTRLIINPCYKGKGIQLIDIFKTIPF